MEALFWTMDAESLNKIKDGNFCNKNFARIPLF